MNREQRIIIFILLTLTVASGVYAKAQAEEAAVPTQNNEWVLSVTNFDISSVPPAKLVVANVITRKMVERLKEINYRTRISHEYAHYEGQAWATARNNAAKQLSAKQEERSLMLYRGDASRRYNQNLERVNAEIEKLWNTYDEINSNPPAINNEPVFSLTAASRNFTFPEPPKEGGESKFLRDQRADAFLSGRILDFHGRFFVSIKLYTAYTRSYAYEDSIIFSNNDLEEALDEITKRLMMLLSGNAHAAIAVKAEPEDALVLINRSFAGRGDTGVLEQAPGKYTVSVSAADHESIIVEDLELLPGELTDLKFFLKPHEYGDVVISGDSPGGAVYQGALYVGQAPLTLRLPVGALEYVEWDTHRGTKGAAVFQTPELPDVTRTLTMRPTVPAAKGRVEKARNRYYWGWGATWLTGIAAWIVYQTYVSSTFAINYQYATTGTYSDQFYNDNRVIYGVSIGAIIAVGAVIVYHYFELGRYIYASNQNATPVVKTGRD